MPPSFLSLTPKVAPHSSSPSLLLLNPLSHHDALRLCAFPSPQNDAAGHANFQDSLFSPTSADSGTLWELSLQDSDPIEFASIVTTASRRLQRSLNLEKGQLLRVLLIDVDPLQPQYLTWVVHHFVADGVSWRVLVEDLWTIYRQLDSGAEPNLLQRQQLPGRPGCRLKSPSLLPSLRFKTSRTGRPPAFFNPLRFP